MPVKEAMGHADLATTMGYTHGTLGAWLNLDAGTGYGLRLADCARFVLKCIRNEIFIFL